MKLKKVIAGVVTLAMVASLAACFGNEGSSSVSTTPRAQTTTPATLGETQPPIDTTGLDQGGNIILSWWGGDARHKATQEAVDQFMSENADIKIETQYGAFDGWEQSMATRFMSGNAPDVAQLNWNWIYLFTDYGTQNVLADINLYSEIIDLSQFDQSALDQCSLADKLQAVPISVTGRIFYWNKTTYEKAGIEPPNSLEELYAATDAIKRNLGDDFYPLVLGEYDRAILMVYYLQSKYGRPWVTDNVLNYTEAEIAEGLQLFADWEDRGVIPTIKALAGDGAASLDRNPKWIDGRYGGIFEWDSSASKFQEALNEGQEFIVGNYLPDFGEHQGGFSKVSMVFGIAENSTAKVAGARVIEYLLNDDVGTSILGSERGIPLSKKAFENTDNRGLLNALVKEANGKVMDWVQFPLDPKFEDAKLRNNPEGVYYDVFSGTSRGYDAYTIEEGAGVLYRGITDLLNS